MATLINGNGNPRIYAAQDADLIAALAGDITGIAQIGNKFAATAVDANTISVADGVIVTKEGRRIQLDAGSTDMFVIPTGTTGVTNYYIIGYKLTTQSDDSQIAETFVQLMSSSSETITEDTFRAGATDVYVSLYRVQQNGVNLGTITGLLPELTNISELKSDLDNAKLLHTITPTSGETWSSVITRIANYLHDNFVEADMPKLVINRDNSFYKVSVFKSNLMTFGNVAGYGEGVSITGASSDYTGGALNTVIINSTGNISVYSNSNTPYSGGDIKIYRV